MFTMNTVFEHGILQKQMQDCILSIKLCLMQSSRLAVLSVVSFQKYVKYFISYQIEIYFASNIQGKQYKQNVQLVCNNNLYFQVYERQEMIIITIIIIQHLHLKCHSFSILVLLSSSLKEFQFCAIP